MVKITAKNGGPGTRSRNRDIIVRQDNRNEGGKLRGSERINSLDTEMTSESIEDMPQQTETASTAPTATGTNTSATTSNSGRVTRSMTGSRPQPINNPQPQPDEVPTKIIRTNCYRLRERRLATLRGYKPSPTLTLISDGGPGGKPYKVEIRERTTSDESSADSEMRDQDQPLVTPPLEGHSRKHPLTGQLRVPALIDDGQSTIDDTVYTEDAEPPKKRFRIVDKKDKKGKAKVRTLYLRRSPRFVKPLTEFHKYPFLPEELKIMIWEAAIEPRVVYICNRAAASWGGLHFGVQNKMPAWFATCHTSAWVARLHYQKMFALQTQFNIVWNQRTIQDVSPNNDIVLFEPCHSGCRGCHCARHQYTAADRAAVRYLAIQTESPNLTAATEPCWQSVTRSWPNVETLYLMRLAIKGLDKRDKAMIRVKKNDLETTLLNRFEEWKKDAGADVKIRNIEFVAVVQKEGPILKPKDRYQSVHDRLTGLPEDIILG